MNIRISLCKISSAIIFSTCFAAKCKAQAHISVNAGISHSINKNIVKEYDSPQGNLIVLYNSYKQYEYPSLLLNGDIAVPLYKKLSLGFKSGVNIHFSEKYFSYYRRTVANVTAQTGLNYDMWQKKTLACGISILSGINIIFLTEGPIKINPGGLYTASFFFNAKRHSFKLGFEKEVQNIRYYYVSNSQYQPDETVKYKQNRLLLFLTYGLILK